VRIVIARSPFHTLIAWLGIAVGLGWAIVLARVLLWSAMSTRALIRSRNRSQTASGKRQAAERSGTRLPEPSACDRCGAVFVRRVWRRDVARSSDRLGRVRWMVCPACTQVGRGEGFGRILIRGEAARTHAELILLRIDHVGKRAAASQPQRRVVSCDWHGDELEVLTTSQKLAHRIVHELKKVLGGSATYHWSADRTLFATWEPRRVRTHEGRGRGSAAARRSRRTVRSRRARRTGS
jgi:hypothetical protein